MDNEDDEVYQIKQIHEADRKRKENEVINRIKQEKELHIKIQEQLKKQKENERKNVTADYLGNIIYVKGIPPEKLCQDFNFPKILLKEDPKIEKLEQPNLTHYQDIEIVSRRSVSLNKEEDKKKLENRIEKAKSARKNLDEKKELVFTIKKDNKQVVQPAGSLYDITIPEVGVTIIESGKQKTGGKEFSKIFQKASKNDYINLIKETTHRKSLDIELFSKEKFGNNSYSNVTNLPKINIPDKSRNKSNDTILMQISHEHMRISHKLSTSLKTALDSLDIIHDYNEDDTTGIIDIFKKRKDYLGTKNLDEKVKIEKGLEEIDKFNQNIIKNSNWGSNLNEKSSFTNFKKNHVKPGKKSFENEVGLKVSNLKMPRSRKINYSFPLKS